MIKAIKMHNKLSQISDFQINSLIESANMKISSYDYDGAQKDIDKLMHTSGDPKYSKQIKELLHAELKHAQDVGKQKEIAHQGLSFF